MKYNKQTPCIYENIKVVYHGIPKNASTSIKNALYEAEWGHSFDGIKQWIHKGNEKGGSIYPKIELIDTKYRSFFHFSVVRNPYDRFKSFYSDLFAKTTNLRNNVPPFYTNNGIVLEPKPVDEVLDIVELFDDDNADEHFASQQSFIYSDRCVFIFQEKLNEQWQIICDRINVEFKHLPMYNKSRDVIHLTDQQKNRIYNRYKEDFMRFKYER